MMSDARSTLLSVVQFALGWRKDYSIPNDVNWKKVISLAQEHGVLAIFADGYEKCLTNIQGQWPKMEQALTLEMVGNVCLYENTYSQHLKALSQLSRIFDKSEISFLVMKGLSCGNYYPVPKHRPCGDIDIFAGENFESSNASLKASGFNVELHYYRHTVSSIYGVTIENHRILCDLRGPRKQTKEFEALLKKYASKSLTQGELYGKDFPSAHYPVADFNALFLPWHVSAHFEFERVTLRHLLDWALFLEKDGNKIDIGLFREAKHKYTFGYGPFADILTDISIRYLGLPKEVLPIEIVADAEKCDKRLSDRVFDRMFEDTIPASDTNIWRERWKLFKYIWNDGWKYRGLYGMNPMKFMLYKIYGVLFKVGED